MFTAVNIWFLYVLHFCEMPNGYVHLRQSASVMDNVVTSNTHSWLLFVCRRLCVTQWLTTRHTEVRKQPSMESWSSSTQTPSGEYLTFYGNCNFVCRQLRQVSSKGMSLRSANCNGENYCCGLFAWSLFWSGMSDYTLSVAFSHPFFLIFVLFDNSCFMDCVVSPCFNINMPVPLLQEKLLGRLLHRQHLILFTFCVFWYLLKH